MFWIIGDPRKRSDGVGGGGPLGERSARRSSPSIYLYAILGEQFFYLHAIF